MDTITISKAAPGFVFAGLALTLGGCQSEHRKDQPKPEAAVTTIFVDGSASTAFIASPAYGDAAVMQVGQMVATQQLGDAFRIVSFGSRTTGRAVDALSIKSGYKRRLPVVRKQVEAQLRNLLDASRKNGGDGATNLLYALENAHPKCTARSNVVILSDGIEDSDAYSANKALAAGIPVRLPPPATPYLKKCVVTFIGIGAAPQGNGSEAETLPNEQLRRLTAGWREYLRAAGVNPDDVTFTTIL